jgi:hypothetical protein
MTLFLILMIAFDHILYRTGQVETRGLLEKYQRSDILERDDDIRQMILIWIGFTLTNVRRRILRGRDRPASRGGWFIDRRNCHIDNPDITICHAIIGFVGKAI